MPTIGQWPGKELPGFSEPVVVGVTGSYLDMFDENGLHPAPAKETADDEDVVVVREGRLLDEALTLERLTPAELLESARNQGIAAISDIRLGILEPDGKFSFLTDDPDRQLAEQDNPAT